MTDTTAVLGYAWPLIVSAGEPIAFHLSSPSLASAEARLVRVRCADPDPDGPGLKLTELDEAANGWVALAEQPIHPGSCAVVADAPALTGFAAFTVGAFVWPTAPGRRAKRSSRDGGTTFNRAGASGSTARGGWSSSSPRKGQAGAPSAISRCKAANGRWSAAHGTPPPDG